MDIIYLGLVQGINYIFPLITFPYLTRVLGLEGFGEYSFILAIMAYITIFISFGYDLSATVTIAKFSKGEEKLQEYLTSIIFVKLSIVIFIILIILTLYISSMINFSYLYLVLAFVPSLIGHALSSTYVFQAREKLKIMSIITAVSRLLTLPLIFIFVSSEDDLFFACIFQSLPYFIAGLVSIFYLIYTGLFKFTSINIFSVKNAFQDGLTLFKLNIATSVYSNSIPVLIGVFSGANNVGIYNIANTLKGVIANVSGVIFRAIFPMITNLIASGNIYSARRVLIKLMKIIIPVSIIILLLIFLYSEKIVYLISGSGYEESASILNILLLCVFMSIINNFFGVQSVLSSGYKRQFSKAIVRSSLLSIFIIIPMVYFGGVIGGAVSVLLTEIIVFIFLFILHRKLDLKLILKKL